MSKGIQKILVALLFASCALGGRTAFAKLVGPGLNSSSQVPNGGIQLSCTLTKDCTQGCGNITVNTSTSTTCYKTDNGNATAEKNQCGLDSAIALAKGCNTPTTITIDHAAAPAITLGATLTVDPKSTLVIDGTSSRTTYNASGGLATAFDIKGTNADGSVTIKNFFFSGFTSGPVIKLESDVKNFRLSNLTSGTGVKLYDNSLASANNSDPAVPLFLSQLGSTLNFFAVVPIGPDTNTIQIVDVGDPTTQDVTSNSDTLIQSGTLKTHALKDQNGTDSSGGTKTVLEGQIPSSIGTSDKHLFLINNPGKNVSVITYDPSTRPNPLPYKDSDNDSIPDVFETLFSLNQSSAANDYSDFYKTMRQDGSDYVVCSDGTKIVSCNSQVTTTAAPGSTSPAPSGTASSGCSLVWQNSENTAFGFVSVAALGLGILAGRRLRFNRVKK